MKKVLTVLAIMIIALGCVFAETPAKGDADGTAQINVKVVIGNEFPRFQLATKTGAEVQTRAVGATGEVPVALMTDTERRNLSTEGGKATVVFAINQTADAHCLDKYKLSVAASDLVLVKSLDGTTVATERTIEAGIADTEVGSETNYRFTVASTTHAATSVTHIDNEGTDANKIYVQYDGVVVKETVEVGTVTVKWNANLDAIAGDYKAKVVLTVEHSN